MRSVVLLSLVFAAVSAEFQFYQPGKELERDAALKESDGISRIIGGSTTTIDNYPWQVSLQTTSHICGASIISPTWVLSAAHCTQQSGYSIRVGSTRHGSGGTVHSVRRVINHPNYNSGAGTIPNDISLIELNTPLTFSSSVQPIALPSSNQGFEFQQCAITGWGRTCGTCGLPNSLMELLTTVIPNSECQTRMSGISGVSIRDFHICVQNGDQSDGSCNGDSGGPMTCWVGGTPVLAGATSWGISSQTTGCIASYPSVYTRVSSYLSWIDLYVTDRKK